MPKIFRGKRRQEINNWGLVVTRAQQLVCTRKKLINDCFLA